MFETSLAWIESRPRGDGTIDEDRQPGLDQRDRPVLELAGGEALGVDVGELLELERSLERDRVADVAAEEEDHPVVGELARQRLDLARCRRAPAGSRPAPSPSCCMIARTSSAKKSPRSRPR